jgi:hypothetical protein
MKNSTKWGILLGVTAVAVWGVFLVPAIPQNPNYHHFADERTLWGVRNFWDVASNFPFFLVSLGGFFTLGRQWKEGRFKGWMEITPYIAFFAGVLLTGWGSSYYHLSPDNFRLVWDRIPMTIIFMSLVSIILMERTTVATGFWALWPLLTMGVGSVIYWSWTESLGRGDLSPYGFVQFYPPLFIGMVLYFFPKPFPLVKDLWPLAAFYALAKVFEFLDEPIYQFTGFMSGHALKHLAAAASVYWILVLLQRRKRLKAEGGLK